MRGDRRTDGVFRVGGAYRGKAASAPKAGDHYVRGASAKAGALGLLFFGGSTAQPAILAEQTEGLRERAGCERSEADDLS